MQRKVSQSATIAGRDLRDLRAFCLVVDFVDHHAHWAHAGDSRVYHFRGAEMQRRTIDHSYVQRLIDEGKIVRVGLAQYEVIGVVGKRPSPGGFSMGQDDFVLIPQTTWASPTISRMRRTVAST